MPPCVRSILPARDEAERGRDAVRAQLGHTQQVLAGEGRARRDAQAHALGLALEQQRLAAALDVERLIK